MIKSEELSDPRSCMSRARPDEMTFVLLERDVTAPAMIYAWCHRRIKLGKNNPSDPQITEAVECANHMMSQYEATKDSRKCTQLVQVNDGSRICGLTMVRHFRVDNGQGLDHDFVTTNDHDAEGTQCKDCGATIRRIEVSDLRSNEMKAKYPLREDQKTMLWCRCYHPGDAMIGGSF